MIWPERHQMPTAVASTNENVLVGVAADRDADRQPSARGSRPTEFSMAG